MPAAPVQTIPTGSPLPVGATSSTLTPKFHVVVRYTKRMRVQRVYRMIVELRPAEKAAAPGLSSGDSVIARPVIPGAHVQPPEQELGPKSSNNKITFSVTPLAAGRLSGSRMQIVHQGRILEEIKTPMRGIRPGRILVWAGLTLLALAYLVGILGPLPDLTNTKPADKPPVPAPAENLAAEPMPAEKAPTPPPAAKKLTVEAALQGKLPDYLKEDELPEGVREHLNRTKLTDYAQEGYNRVYTLPHLNFHIMLALLALTLVSVFFNRPALLRSRRKGKAMMLPSLP
jgi:hypothetical protein